jgi:hypothetical protein
MCLESIEVYANLCAGNMADLDIRKAERERLWNLDVTATVVRRSQRASLSQYLEHAGR